jgi:Ca2+-binding RTX toxin-like protein
VTVADASQIDYEANTSHEIGITGLSSDGSNATKTFTIDVIDTSSELNNDTNTVNEESLADGTNPSSSSVTTTGNIFDNDDLAPGSEFLDINIAGGMNNTVGEILTVTTAEGNTLSVNVNSASANFGAYTYTLVNKTTHPDADGENTIIESFAYSVTDVTSSVKTANLDITIIDDTPIAPDQTVNLTIEQSTTNLTFIVDISASMSDNDLELVEDAIESLISSYDHVGEVNVNIIQFFEGGNISSGWRDETLSVSLNTGQSGTDIAQGLEAAVDLAYGTDIPPDADQDFMYFFGDGNTYDSFETDFNDYLPTWYEFINSGAIDKLFSFSINTNTVMSDINKVAYDAENIVSQPAVNVENVSDLDDAITQTIYASDNGSIFENGVGVSTIQFGADGGNIESVTIGSSTITFDANNITQTIVGSVGEYIFNFETGEYTYRVDLNAVSFEDHTDSMIIAITDNDGDQSSTIHSVNITYNVVDLTSPFSVVVDGSTVTYGGSVTQTVDMSSYGVQVGDMITISNIEVVGDIHHADDDFSIKFTQAGADIQTGELLIAGHVGNSADFHDIVNFSSIQVAVIADINGDPVLTFTGISGGYRTIDDYRFEMSGVGTVSVLGADTVNDAIIKSLDDDDPLTTGNDRVVGGDTTDDTIDTIDGLAGDDQLFGLGGDDTLLGNADNDILFGGVGDDILTGGTGADIFVFNLADGTGSTDTIIDFSLSEGDVLNFSDFLQNEDDTGADLASYLHVSFDGSDSTITANSENDGSGSDLTVVIQDVDLNGLGVDQADILQSLIDSNNLTVDQL